MQRLDLRLYMVLTTLESALIGIPIIQARSLSAGGYSLPRLILLLAWLVIFAVCTWISFSIFKQETVSENLRLFIEPKYFSIREWLIVLSLLCWGGITIFFLQRDFLTFIWNSLPNLFEQYILVILIIGIWAIQSLVALRMIKPKGQDENIVFPKAVQVFLVAFFLYTCTAVDLHIAPYSTTAYFPELAQSFLHGRVDLVHPLATKDLTLFNGKYYVSFPPLGALLMTPLVAMRGLQEFNILLFNIVFASLGVTLMFLTLEAMRARGLSQLPWWGHAALALFLGFGTAQYSMALRGLVNFTSQILTTTFLALALWVVMSLRRNFQVNALLAGSALALAMLARPNVIFVWIALAALQLQFLYDDEKFRIKYFLQWSALSLIPIFAAIAGLFWYNQIRFGSPFDFGYEYMLVSKVLIHDLKTYGQFHPYFILKNLRDNFLRLPYWDENCHMLTFFPNGTSIFLTSPLLLYSIIKKLRSLSANHQSPITNYQWISGAWLSVGIIALLHALYYNSGAVQVGYRFSLDFMPVIVMLLAFAFKKKISITALVLIALSIFVNYFGVLWTLHRWCENF
jgi:hypothetical protein